MIKNTQEKVIERIMVKAFGENVRYIVHGHPDTLGENGFVECKAWLDRLRPAQIQFYEYLKEMNLEHLWTLITEDQNKNVYLFKTPEEYFKFKISKKKKHIEWDRVYPTLVSKTSEQSSDGSYVYNVACPDPYTNPRCRGARKMTRKAVADSARVFLGLCQSCAALKKNGYGDRLCLIREQAPKGTMKQTDFAKSIGADQSIVSNIVKAFGIEWKRADGRASNKSIKQTF